MRAEGTAKPCTGERRCADAEATTYARAGSNIDRLAAIPLASCGTLCNPPLVLAALALAQTLAAAPLPTRVRSPVEFTTQLSLAGGARCDQSRGCYTGVFSLALRMDVLALRNHPRDVGLGPFVSTRTDNFDDIAPSLGISVLLPLDETFPFVVSAGGVLRIDRDGVAAGVLERLWFGARSFNLASPYVLSGGAFVEVREFADAPRTVDVIAGFDGDLQFLAIPFILLYNKLFRHQVGE